MKLNREQTIKALECCAKVGGHRDAHHCNDCPLQGERCALELPKNALALVRAQRKENERLTAQVEQSEITIKDLRSRNHELTRANMSLSKYADELQFELAECVQIKADTVRKMQERLKEAPIKVGLPLFGLHTKDEIEDYANGLILQMRDVIDQIAKEMLEEDT